MPFCKLCSKEFETELQLLHHVCVPPDVPSPATDGYNEEEHDKRLNEEWDNLQKTPKEPTPTTGTMEDCKGKQVYLQDGIMRCELCDEIVEYRHTGKK